MAGRVKCSYKDCYQHFSSQKAMIKHKTSAAEHEYCKRCDVDCDDDIAFLIHQMTSPKHISCCICGEEFKSEAGRDGHVELYHRKIQNIQCKGCKKNFAGASALMRHIENNECDIISAKAFESRRAGQQIEKDAWESVLDPNKAPILPSRTSASEADTDTGGVSLLDDDRVFAYSGLQGNSSSNQGPSTLQPVSTNVFTVPRPIAQPIGPMSLDKFPALPTQQSRKSSNQEPNSTGDLLDFDEPVTTYPIQKGAAWKSTTSSSQKLFPDASRQSSQRIGMFEQLGPQHVNDSRNPDAHVKVAPNVAPQQSKVDPQKYFDPIVNKFVCPGRNCGRQYVTPEDFSAHLLTDAHTGGLTTCPSCLKKFANTANLIAHCESNSRKCNIRKSVNYNQVMRELTAGLIGTDGHLVDGSVRYVPTELEEWK